MKRYNIIKKQQAPTTLLLIALLSHLQGAFYAAAAAETGGAVTLIDANTSTTPQPQHNQRQQDGRIVGGIETSIVSFPHQLSLQWYETHICGAALITSEVALTAAHCVAQFDQPHSYTIRAGSTEHVRGGIVMQVNRIIPHELFHKPTLMNNDIALVQLTNPLTFNRYIQPIALMSKTKEEVYMPSKEQQQLHRRMLLFVSGWGAISGEVLVKSPRLRYTVIQPLNQAKCSLAYEKFTINITENMLCAGTLNGGRDSCQGDSGGPLITYVNGRRKLFGIVSFGIGCANVEYPGVYTLVAEYEQWIKDTMKKI